MNEQCNNSKPHQMPPNRKPSKPKPTPFPKPLRYLHPFLKTLAKLPLDQLNEDLDPTRLESALRKRLRGLDEDAAETQITKDHKLLKSWLKTFDSRLHPAHWIVGYLSFPPDIAAALTKPPESPLRDRKLTFDPPPGWKVKSFPLQLDLNAGTIVGTIMASDESSFDLRVSQYETAHATRPPRVQAISVVSKITRGRTTGKRSEEHTSELQSLTNLVCRLLL